MSRGPRGQGTTFGHCSPPARGAQSRGRTADPASAGGGSFHSLARHLLYPQITSRAYFCPPKAAASNTDLPDSSIISHRLINVEMQPLKPGCNGTAEMQSFVMPIDTTLLRQRYAADAVFPKNSPFYRQPGTILQFVPPSSFQSVQITHTCSTEPSTAA